MSNWVDGSPADLLSVRDRGLAYGDGLFETIAVRAGRPRLLARHLARLEEGGRRLRMALPLELIEQELLAFCADLGEGVAKLLVTRGDGLRGYAAASDAPVRRILLGSPTPAYPPQHSEHGVTLYPCSTRLAEQPLLAGLKHLNRLEQVLARAEWSDPAIAEGLMRDQSGRVIEGVFSNLFLVRDGQLKTADLGRCGVSGVMRAELIERATALGLPVIIGDIEYTELLEADEVFLCNSLYGIWPVRQMAEHSWPLGRLTRKLQDNLRETLDF
ncbi:Aminodeoxychorismate lyase [compost metagenome]